MENSWLMTCILERQEIIGAIQNIFDLIALFLQSVRSILHFTYLYKTDVYS